MKIMRKILGIITIAALLISVIPLMAQPANAEDTGTISGHVCDADTGSPIDNLHVMAIEPVTYEWKAGTFTNPDGSYTLGNLPEGSYLVRTKPSETGLSYVERWYDNAIHNDEATPVPVTAGSDTPGIDFNLEKGGTISGRVTDDTTGDGIPNARVDVVIYESLSGQWIHCGWADTDGSGNYTTSLVPTGNYAVRASADGYVAEWYPGSYNHEGADPVSATALNNTPGIDFSLGLGGTISGYVYEVDGVTPIPDLHVNTVDATTYQWLAGTNTNPDGSYTLGSVPAGDYLVRARPSNTGLSFVDQWYEGVFNSEDATPVSVEVSTDTPGIDFNLEQGGTISGRVTNSTTGEGISNARLEIFDYESMSGPWENYGWGETDENGYYTTSAVPTGSYAIRARADTYIVEWYAGVYFHEEVSPVPVTVLNDTPGINFSLELGGTISGRIIDSTTGEGIAYAGIEVATYESLPGHHIYFEGGMTDENGNYIVSPMPAGDYGVRVRADGYAREWYQDTYNQDEATPVPVTVLNDTPGIDFSLELGGTISGTVYQEDETTPIPNIHMHAADPATGYWISDDFTDANGTYTLDSLPSGSYVVGARPSDTELGYVNQFYDDVYKREDGTPVTVNAPGDTPSIDFTLEPGGTISGHVYEADGMTPIYNAHIHAEDATTYEWVGGINTKPDGSYSLTLPGGSYVIMCHGEPYFISEWYDDVYAKSQATPIQVTVPQEVPDKDFVLDALVPRPNAEAAIADGIEWLVSQQNEDGSWGDQYPLAKTGLAVLKLNSHAADLGISPFDSAYPYNTHVQAGLDYIFSKAYITGINTQFAGNPDKDGDGIGVYFYIPGEGHNGSLPVYNTSIVMMAIASTTTPGRVVNVAGSPVDNWTYYQVLRDAVDYLSWSQTDTGYGRGGWNYTAMNNTGPRSDQSNSGWATLALAHAQTPPPIGFSIPVPGFVKTELDIWIDYIQDDVDGDETDGGAWYTGPDASEPDQAAPNILKAGNLLMQMALAGDSPDTPRVQDAIDYMVRHWYENHDPGWRGDPSCFHSTYTAMKGLEALSIDTIGGMDWFQDFTDALLNEQAGDGWWLSCRWDTGDRILSTLWAMLTLQRVAPPSPPPPPPVADAGGPYLIEVNAPLTLDGSGSYDTDGQIVDYCWTFGDGTTGGGVKPTHTYSAVGIYPIELTVTDNVGGIDTDSNIVVVYDPDIGFATGGGWLIPGSITSDEGDNLPEIDGTSPAEFGFVVKYKPGATEPDGQLEFQYRQGNFNLHSNGMEWLVIVNNNWAKFQGTATIKGFEGEYPFRVDARDGDFGGNDELDRFIIKVYAPGADTEADSPIYKASGDLQGGSIVIHAKEVTKLCLQTWMPSTDASFQLLEDFAQTVEERTGGSVVIDVYPQNALVPTNELAQAVQQGDIEMGLLLSSLLGEDYPLIYGSSLPFLYNSSDGLMAAVQAGIGDLLAAELSANNITTIDWVSLALANLFLKDEPLILPDTLAGKNIRSVGNPQIFAVAEWGATPITLPAFQLYSALESGTIDGLAFPINACYSFKLYEVSPNYTVNSAFSNLAGLCINSDVWNSLKLKEKNIISEAASEYSANFKAFTEQADADALQFINDYGISVYELSPEQRAVWRQASQSTWDAWLSLPDVGPIGQQIIDIALQHNPLPAP